MANHTKAEITALFNDSMSHMSDAESEHSKTSFTKKLTQIEREINRTDLSKREKRLL